MIVLENIFYDNVLKCFAIRTDEEPQTVIFRCLSVLPIVLSNIIVKSIDGVHYSNFYGLQ